MTPDAIHQIESALSHLADAAYALRVQARDDRRDNPQAREADDARREVEGIEAMLDGLLKTYADDGAGAAAGGKLQESTP